jgi:hypothetical protein
MSKLSLDALKERAKAVASEELLNSISGGTENSCHDEPEETSKEIDCSCPQDQPFQVKGTWLIHTIFH